MMTTATPERNSMRSGDRNQEGVKDMKKATITILIAIMAIFASGAVAFAGEVSYEGEADGFVFSPGGSSSPTNLFSNFGSVMPGDSLTDTVDVANNSDKTAKIYMRALGASDEDKDFLSQINLTVNQNDGELFDAAADQQAGLADWVLLGTMSPGAKATLDLTIDVPLTMNNDYQNAAGTVNWQFKAETEDNGGGGGDGDDDGDGGKSAKTGDQIRLGLLIAILAIAAAGIITVAVRRRRQ